MLDHANIGIGSMQRILGHENRTTTELYFCSIGEAEREAMKVLEITIEEKVVHKVAHQKGCGRILKPESC